MTRFDLHPEPIAAPPARRIAAALAALVLCLAAFGCTSEAPLARVGRRVVTRADFDAAAANNWAQYQDVPERAKQRLLDDLVKRELLLLVADQRGLTANERTQAYRLGVEDQVLSTAVTQQLTPRSVPVTEAEIEEFYGWIQISAHLEVMYSPDRALIDAALARVRAGQSFGELAQQVNPSGLLPPNGDLGEVTVGTMVDPLDEFARSAPLGELVGPVTGGGEGWFVARVLSRRQVPPPAPLEVMRGQLANMLRQRKLRALAARIYLGLRDQYQIEIGPSGPGALYSYLNARILTPEGGAPPAMDPAAPLARYADSAGRPLTYTLGDAALDLQRSDRERPDATGTPALRLWIGQSVVQRVLVLEARRRGLDRDPQIARRISAGVENGVLETVYTDEVSQAVTVSPDDVERAYQMQAAQFPLLDAARIQVITLPDSSAAAELTRHGSHAPSLIEAARMMGLADRASELRVTFPSRDPAWQALEPQLMMMTRGEWAGPTRVEGGWRVFEVLEKETHPRALDQLKDSERQSIQQLALEIKRDQRLTAVTDSLKRATHPFEIRDQALAHIPWPPAA
ncbi:MAG: peptidylprolyl isomerase, partial [Candidatus Eiseniibacteriota bacterium]